MLESPAEWNWGRVTADYILSQVSANYLPRRITTITQKRTDCKKCFEAIISNNGDSNFGSFKEEVQKNVPERSTNSKVKIPRVHARFISNAPLTMNIP